MKGKIFASISCLSLLAVVSLVLAVPAAAQDVHTVDVTGTGRQIFDNRGDVYIRAPPTVPSQPDSTYAFVVTNPSGSVLLSTDADACRQVVVSGGLFTRSLSGIGNPESLTSARGQRRNYLSVA